MSDAIRRPNENDPDKRRAQDDTQKRQAQQSEFEKVNEEISRRIRKENEQLAAESARRRQTEITEFANEHQEMLRQMRQKEDEALRANLRACFPVAQHEMPMRVFRPPEVKSPVVENIQDNQASEFHRRLVEWITSFDAGLDDAHEVGVRLVSFGQTLVFHLEDLGYWNPSLISFAGKTEQGDPVELIQHVSQISILLMKLPRQDTSTPKRPIGFHSTRDQGEPDSSTPE